MSATQALSSLGSSIGAATGAVLRPASDQARGPRRAFLALTLGATAGVTALAAQSIDGPPVAAALALVLLTASVLWIAGGAATALVGLLAAPPARSAAPAGWRPLRRTAVLMTLCNEPPEAAARQLAALARSLDAGPGRAVEIHVLSDTHGPAAVAREDAAFKAAIRDGLIRYRRRVSRTGAKPGNIADWLRSDGAAFDFMLLLDADSRMGADRIRALIFAMERDPSLGLLQAGIGLVPARSRFGQMQRNAVRLLSPGFGAGLAAWSGRSGNFWGHNAIIRVAAFADTAAPLPVLSGSAPLGGPILSHDFVEAAFLRRKGWAVALDPALKGSAEDAPQTLDAFHRRDRRWCQGNLQHLRLIAAPGLRPLSRLHMAAGIGGYLAAPLWLGLLALGASGAVRLTSALPLLAIGLLLLVPKVCGLARLARRATRWRAGVALRASCAELAVSALVAPLVMVRQSASVAGVLAGRDCGWKSARPAPDLPIGLVEAGAGVALLGLALLANPDGLAWLAPVAAPLVAAPWLIRWLEAAR